MRNRCAFALIQLALIVGAALPAGALELCLNGEKLGVRSNCPEAQPALTSQNLNSLAQCPRGAKGATGAAGAEGAAGEKGPRGEDGERGEAAFTYGDAVPPGAEIYGTLGGDFRGTQGADEEGYIYGSFFGVLPAALDPDDIVIKIPGGPLDGCQNGDPCVEEDGRGAAKQARCSGDALNPEAQPGTLCVYPTYLLNIEELEPSEVQTKFGFSLEFHPRPLSDFSAFAGVWIYKAP